MVLGGGLGSGLGSGWLVGGGLGVGLGVGLEVGLGAGLGVGLGAGLGLDSLGFPCKQGTHVAHCVKVLSLVRRFISINRGLGGECILCCRCILQEWAC